MTAPIEPMGGGERWARAEEEHFGRTLAQGERLLADLIAQAKQDGTSWIDAEDAFRLHDTYGFPYEMTKELLAEDGCRWTTRASRS